MKRFLPLCFVALISNAMLAYDVDVDGIFYNLFPETKTAEVAPKSDDQPQERLYKGSMTIPDTMYCNETAYRVVGVGPSAFINCNDLLHVELPNGLQYVADKAFMNCTKLQHMILPDSVVRVGEKAFFNCQQLTALVLPDMIIEIGNEAFAKCYKLTSLAIPKHVCKIGINAFCDCNLSLVAVHPENKVYCSRRNCDAIIERETQTLIVGSINTRIPDSVATIGYGAFAYCTGPENMFIPRCVTKIEDNAFYGCNYMKSLKLSSTLQSIGAQAFANCTAIKEISCRAEVPPVCGENAFKNVNKKAQLYVPIQSIEAYENADGWREFEEIVALPTKATKK